MNSENKMGLEDWIGFLKKQAEDSREYRLKLYEKVNLKNKKKILDVACGTGAITIDLADLTEGEIIGIDIDKAKLQEAMKIIPKYSNLKFMEGNAEIIPFDDETFDLVHFSVALMHLKNQQKGVNEMVRVTKKGGIMLATMEPDYNGRMIYPEIKAYELIKKFISEEIGADISSGRKLKVLFNKAGLKTTVGIDTLSEYNLCQDDEKNAENLLKGFGTFEKILKNYAWPEEKIEDLKKEMYEKIKKGEFFSFLPCFHAIGIK